MGIHYCYSVDRLLNENYLKYTNALWYIISIIAVQIGACTLASYQWNAYNLFISTTTFSGDYYLMEILCHQVVSCDEGVYIISNKG